VSPFAGSASQATKVVFQPITRNIDITTGGDVGLSFIPKALQIR
jgi:hypothetical protein